MKFICNYIVSFLLVLLLSECKHKKDNAVIAKKHNLASNATVIDIQPFNDIANDDIVFAYNQLKLVYPYINIKKAISLPKWAYYEERNRYRADSLIRFLSKICENGHVVIGLTSKDISTNKDKIKDWGVMGLGYCPGNACIASTFRLSKENKKSQFYKVAVHELGHTQGLPHCANKTCFMQDAEGGNTTNNEKDFCNHCKQLLTLKGWKF
ncbi:MAG: matrixin family metalloprotease [Chitinophagaceae bacterium]